MVKRNIICMLVLQKVLTSVIYQLVFHVYGLELDNLPTSRTCRATEKVIAKGRVQPLMREGAFAQRSAGGSSTSPPPASSGQQEATSQPPQTQQQQQQQSAAGLQQTPGSRTAYLLEAELVSVSTQSSERESQPQQPQQSRSAPPAATASTSQLTPLTLDTASLGLPAAPSLPASSSPTASSNQQPALSDAAEMGRISSFKAKGALILILAVLCRGELPSSLIFGSHR